MKRKIFSILFALVLVISFSLVTVVPVGAQVGPVISSTDIQGPYVVGVEQEFSIKTTSDTPYDTVLFKFVVENAVLANITSFEYYETADSQWHSLMGVFSEVGNNLEGYFGPPGGFPMEGSPETLYDVTTLFRINFNTPKTYPVTVSLVDLSTEPETVITTVNFEAVVAGCVNDTTGVTYGIIQAAIDAASDGDTITVAAGTYVEEIKIMDKSLTLLGAQADVPIVNGERAGEESIIRGKVTDSGYRSTYCVARIQNSNVVINGFTIESAKQWNIAIQGSSIRSEGISNILISYNYIEESGRDGIFRDSAAADVTITHNYIASNSWRGILTNGGATTITDNTFYGNGKGIELSGGDPYDVYFPDYAEPNYPTIISGNTFTNDSTSITLRLDECHQSITVTGNDITEASSAAIKTRNVYDVDIVNPAIHFNNIWNNEFGINNTVTEINLDALYNYWGDETGPDATLNPGAQGDAVSENVLFSPWLYETQENFVPDAPCYAGSVVIGNEATEVVVEEIASWKGGWNSFSTPVTLDGSADYISELLDLTADSGLFIVRAQRFDPTLSQPWVPLIMNNTPQGEDYEIKPDEGFFIQVKSEGSLPILCSTTATSPPMTNLVAGWNLVGLSNLREMTVANALHNVDYSVVISASPPNATSWSVPPDDAILKVMELGEAYWLGMGQPGILFGHTTTPVANDMIWELNQN